MQVATEPMFSSNGFMTITLNEQDYDAAYHKLFNAVNSFKYVPKNNGPKDQRMTAL